MKKIPWKYQEHSQVSRRSKRPSGADGDRPSISLVVPAYNEADYLEATLTSAKAAATEYGGAVEIIVVDNNSTDNTGEIARDLGATMVFEPINQIARARNAGAAIASGDYLVFLDADTRIEGDVLCKVANNLASGEVIGGGALVESDSKGPGRFLMKYLVNYVLMAANLSVGPFLYSKRDVFLKLGGFDEEFYAAEEFVLAKRMQAEGRKLDKRWKIITYDKGHRIVTSSRRFGKLGGLEMAFRNAHLLWKSDKKLRRKDQCSFWYGARG
jgi:glycosyltransferase involved in cell wall biosynthesis